MTTTRHAGWSLFSAVFLTAALLGLPLLGVVLTDKPTGQYLEFPPTTHYVEHAPFSSGMFIGLALLSAVVILPFVVRMVTSSRHRPPQSCQSGVTPPPSLPVEYGEADKAAACRRRFPWWGWFGLILGAGAWLLAWTRFPEFEPLQRFTFSPLWFAYILVVNALTYRRTGRCMLKDRSAYFAWLFPISAAFWWFFEYLNRFVQNWYYTGTEGLTPIQYFLYATLPFATVLPAVMGTYELFATVPRLSAGLDRFLPIPARRPRLVACIGLIGACAGLAGIGRWPDHLYPLVWLAPLLIMVSLQTLRGRPTLLSAIARGDWRRIVLLALAALVCGGFWEMWNYHSLAKWIYTVPYVSRFKVFEMPILGFAGYLPFGLECAVIADAVARWSAPVSS